MSSAKTNAGQDTAHTLDEILPDAAGVVVFDQSVQSVVANASDLHAKLYGYTVRLSRNAVIVGAPSRTR